MKQKKIVALATTFLFIFEIAVSQKGSSNFVKYYPIGEDPSVCYKTSYVKNETIIFEANPIVKYSIYNNFLKGLSTGKKYTHGWFMEIRPQVRMYAENSYPIKMPSYRFFIGTQHLFKVVNNNFLAFSIESGHYSNGQSMSALSEKYADGSKESDSLYSLITPKTNLSQIINRRTGNFSSDLAEIILNYRINRLDKDQMPYKISSFKLGIIVYQKRFLGIANFGSYSANDIKLYGKYRFLFGYEYTHVFKKGDGIRMSFAENIELIKGAQQSVNPLRTETIITLYPFINLPTLGIFTSYIYGHDNYNLRFVDSGQQVAIGISWSQFPPFQVNKIEKKAE
jgi:hypothetical protein